MKKRYTSQDIADMLGISRGTVYRALNNKGRINVETRNKVVDTAKKLGYKPNKFARALVMQKTIKIAAILPSIPEHFYSDLEEGIKRAEKEMSDYEIHVDYFLTGAANDALTQIDVFEKIKNEKYDGIVLVPANSNLLRLHVDATVERGTPVVVANNDVPYSKRLCYVGENSIQAGKVSAELMGKFLDNSGQVAILSGFSDAKHLIDRAEAFTEVLKRDYTGIEFIGSYGFSEDIEEAYSISERLIKDYPNLRGMFVTSTTGLEPVGRAVWDSSKQNIVRVLGFDYSRKIEALMQQNVIYSSIYQDQYAQGRYALKVLTSYLLEGIQPKKERIYTRIGVLLKEMPNMSGYILHDY